MEEYFTIGNRVFGKMPNSPLWAYKHGKQLTLISYLEMCRVLSRLWILNKADKHAMERYNKGEFGWGGAEYDGAKRLRYIQHKLTNLILTF